MNALLVVWILIWVLALYVGYSFGSRAGRRRTLRDLPPPIELPSTIHECGGEWGKWETLTVYLYTKEGEKKGALDAMERSCGQCGFVQRRKLTV